MAIRPYLDHHPEIHTSAYVAPEAIVIGAVNIGADASIWPMAVARGDVERIVIGARSNVQDGSVLHVTHDGPFTPGGRALIVGQDVTVGHQAVLHACTIGNSSLVGMGALLMDDVEVGEACLIAAGSVVPPGKKLRAGTLWRGSPARLVRELSSEEIAELRYSADLYVRLKNDYMSSPRPA